MATSKKKKIIAISIVAAMMSQPVYLSANGLADIIDGYENSTSAGSWTNPMNGTTYLYGGSYQFKFKNNKNYAPWIQAEAPSFKIGCNGFSIKGGFLSLIGLNDIQEQLQSSGAALAWGIMMGLVYSMPGIKEVFTTIQQWARFIQSLLQNACNIGQAIANGSIDLGPLKTITEQAVGSSSSEIKTHLESPAKQIAAIDSFFAKAKDFAPGKILPNGLKEAASPSIALKNRAKQLSAGTTGLVAAQIGSSASIPDSYAGLIKDGLKGVLTNKTISGKDGTSIPVSRLTDVDVVRTKILLTFFGDIGVSSTSAAELLTFFNSDGALDMDKLKEDTKAAMNGSQKKIEVGAKRIQPVITNASDAARVLLYGFGAVPNACNTNTTDNTCKIPNYELVGFAVPNDMPSGATNTTDTGISTTTNTAVTKKYLMLVSSPSNSTDTIDFKWDGYMKESKKGVEQLVNRYRGVSASTPIYAPMLLPNIQRYAKTIAMMDKVEDRNNYIELVAKKNSYFSALALANEVEAKVIEMLTDGNLMPSKDSAKEVSDFLRFIQERKKDILTEVKRIHEDDKTLDDIEKIFEKLENNFSRGVVGALTPKGGNR